MHHLALKWQAGEVRHPDMVLIQRTFRHEQIRINHLDILGFLPLSASPAVCLDAEEIHHPLNRFAVHLDVQSDSSRAV